MDLRINMSIRIILTVLECTVLNTVCVCIFSAYNQL